MTQVDPTPAEHPQTPHRIVDGYCFDTEDGQPNGKRPCAERRENPKHLRIGITNRMILGGMSGPDAKRLIDEYDAACARSDQ